MKYIALLRGINVGGNTIVSMAKLKVCFENIGCTEVVTYINSGNVVFESTDKNKAKLTQKITKAISKDIGKEIPTLLVSLKELETVVKKAPKRFGTEPTKYRYDAIFLFPSITPQQALKAMPIKEGVDEIHMGPKVIYFSRLIGKATQSKLNKIVGTPIYKQMTIRNWNTTTKLLALSEK